MDAPVTQYEVQHLLTAQGWLSPGYLGVDAKGFVVGVRSVAAAEWRKAEILKGLGIPGVPNAHSHAFQRAMAGRAEYRHADNPSDSFWSWRNRMYALAQVLTPDEVEAVAAWAYAEMLKAGFTTVAEFHYLHHQPDGSPYDAPEELSLGILRAARNAGVALTLLPVFYAHAGIGRAPEALQRRFVHRDVHGFMMLWQRIRNACVALPGTVLGVAPHSLRAVSSEELPALVEAVHQAEPQCPVHIHVAEQPGEVAECVEKLGARPVQWLMEHLRVDERWCLVHATHTLPEEVASMARSRAVVCVCPTTEANLGDGLFDVSGYRSSSGRMAVGTDSNVSIDVAEELRWLEYGQRLNTHRRNVMSSSIHQPHTGRDLLDTMCLGGALACGQPVGRLEAGMRADLVVLDGEHPSMVGLDRDEAVDAWIFSNHAGPVVRHVMVGGNWQVRDGRHVREEDLFRRYAETIRSVNTRLP